MNLVNQVRSSWCPKYQKIWEISRLKKDMFVPCEFEETILSDIQECRITHLTCKNCSYSLSIYSIKESRLEEINRT